jgi:hypothetical protein
MANKDLSAILTGMPPDARTCSAASLVSKGTDGPAALPGKLLNGNAGFVDRADVAHLHRGALCGLLDPPQRQALGTADIGPVLIDPARPLPVEEGARPFRVRIARFNDLCGMVRYVLGLDLEDGDIVDAARGASRGAVQPAGVDGHEPERCLVHLEIESLEGLQDVTPWSRGTGHVNVPGIRTDPG